MEERCPPAAGPRTIVALHRPPRARTMRRTSEIRFPARMTASNIRVVLCHAHAGLRTGLQHLLDAADGIEVVGAAADTGDGVEVAARLAPDVVLMDLAMPSIDAVAATHRIAAMRPRTRVLIVTGFPHPARIRDAMQAGASGYVLKDSPVSQLAYAIEAVASGHRYLSPAAVEAVIDKSGTPVDRVRSRYDLLTRREREILKLLADGLSVKEIASGLGRSVKTAEVHTYNLMQKLGVHTRAAVIKYAIAHRLVAMPVVEDEIAS